MLNAIGSTTPAAPASSAIPMSVICPCVKLIGPLLSSIAGCPTSPHFWEKWVCEGAYSE